MPLFGHSPDILFADENEEDKKSAHHVQSADNAKRQLLKQIKIK